MEGLDECVLEVHYPIKLVFSLTLVFTLMTQAKTNERTDARLQLGLQKPCHVDTQKKEGKWTKVKVRESSEFKHAVVSLDLAEPSSSSTI